MLKTERKTIDGLEVTTIQLPAMRAYTLLAKLIKVVGPVVGTLGQSNIGQLIGKVFENLDPSDLPNLVREILEQTSIVVDGKQITLNTTQMIDLAFSERLPMLLDVMAFVLETNYSGFFDEGGSLNLSGALPGMQPNHSTSPST